MLEQLQTWYAARCNGEWEQEFGVSIGTLEGGGWELRVDLVGTPLAGNELARELKTRSNVDWVEAWSDGFTFNATGGAGNLGDVVEAFSRFAADRSEALPSR